MNFQCNIMTIHIGAILWNVICRWKSENNMTLLKKYFLFVLARENIKEFLDFSVTFFMSTWDVFAASTLKMTLCITLYQLWDRVPRQVHGYMCWYPSQPAEICLPKETSWVLAQTPQPWLPRPPERIFAWQTVKVRICTSLNEESNNEV